MRDSGRDDRASTSCMHMRCETHLLVEGTVSGVRSTPAYNIHYLLCNARVDGYFARKMCMDRAHNIGKLGVLETNYHLGIFAGVCSSLLRIGLVTRLDFSCGEQLEHNDCTRYHSFERLNTHTHTLRKSVQFRHL